LSHSLRYFDLALAMVFIQRRWTTFKQITILGEFSLGGYSSKSTVRSLNLGPKGSIRDGDFIIQLFRSRTELTQLKLDYLSHAMLWVNNPLIDFKCHLQPLIATFVTSSIAKSTTLFVQSGGANSFLTLAQHSVAENAERLIDICSITSRVSDKNLIFVQL
jgi:hypothetical protein